MGRFVRWFLRVLTGSKREPNLDELLERSDALIASIAPRPRRPAANSKRRHTFSGGNTMEQLPMHMVPRLIPRMLRQMRSFRRSMREAERHAPVPQKAVADLDRERIARRLRELGALEYGLVEIPDYAVFRDKVAPYPHAIVFTAEMDRELMRKAPSPDSLLEVQDAYARAGTIANQLAGYLRSLGYNAIPGHPTGGVVDYPLLGKLAALGELGRNGLLISRTRGVSQRIAVVYTDLTGLEFGEKEDYSWVADFCAACGKCVRACPVGALHPEQREDEFGQMTTTDGDRCLPYFHSHYGCSICVGVCPFTVKDYGAIKQAWQKRQG